MQRCLRAEVWRLCEKEVGEALGSELGPLLPVRQLR